MFKLPEAVPETYDSGDGVERMIERPLGVLPPCGTCEKGVAGGPDTEGLFTLSDENYQLLELYRRLESPGFELPKHLVGDHLFADRWCEVQSLMMAIQRDSQASRIAGELARYLV